MQRKTSSFLCPQLGGDALLDSMVHIDQRIEFEGHRVSESHALMGQALEARVTVTTKELLRELHSRPPIHRHLS